METAVIIAIIQIFPAILTLAVVLILVAIFKKPLEKRLIPRLSSVKFMGVEITLLKAELDEAASSSDVPISEGDKWNALIRAQHVSPVIQGAKILWVGDEPQQKQQLIKILRNLDANVDQVKDTDQAIKMLRRHQYDVVISDIKRREGSDAGIKMVSRMWDEHIYRWTIFYVADLKLGVPELPKYTFNITDRPDHLLHFIMDVLERARWSNYSGQ